MPRIKDPDDPRRCRATAASTGGQCQSEAVGKSDFCSIHGGRVRDIEEMHDYLTQQFEQRLKLEGDATDEVKLLRENLMRLNMMLAARQNLVTDESSLLAHSGPIADLLMKAEKVTVSLNRLEERGNFLLAKPALIVWCQQIVDAVSETIENKYDGWEDDLIDLSDKVASIVVNIQNTEDTK